MVNRLYPVVNLNAYQPAHGQSCSWLSIPTASPSACRRSHRQHVALAIESAASHPPSTFERCLFISLISYLRRLFCPLHRISPSSLLLWHSLFSSSPTLLSLCKKKQKFKQRASKIPISMNPQLIQRNSSPLNLKGYTKMSTQRLKWCLDTLFKRFQKSTVSSPVLSHFWVGPFPVHR